jgi:hypothetical protein
MWFPSIILRNEEGKFIVGEDAARRGQAPLRSVKRLLEQRSPDSQSRLEKDLEGQGLKLHDADTIQKHGQTHSLRQLVSEILREARRRVERLKGPIRWQQTTVHLGCSVHFRKEARRLLVDCAHNAGFENVSISEIIPEPVAAALAMLKRDEEVPGRPAKDEAVCLSDFGGGTFDVACVARFEGRFFVLFDDATVIGGDDMDRELEALVVQAFRDRDGIEREELLDLLGNGDRDYGAFLFHDRCKEVKQRLSEQTSAFFEVPHPSGLRIGLSRAAFDECIRRLVEEAIQVRDRAIWACGKMYGKDRFKFRHYLLGGVSHTPLVQRLFGGKQKYESMPVDPSAAIAIGESFSREYDDLDRGRPQFDILVEGEDGFGKVVRTAYEAYDPLWTTATLQVIGACPAWKTEISFSELVAALRRIRVLARSVDGSICQLGEFGVPQGVRKNKSVNFQIHTNHKASVFSIDGESWGQCELPSYSSAILKADPVFAVFARMTGAPSIPVYRGCGGDDEPG